MNCRPLFCEHRPDCADHHCEGHPRNLGVEAALPPTFTAAPVKPPRDWTAFALKCAVIVATLFALAAAWPIRH